MQTTLQRVPAPWKLRTRGFLLLYRFERDFLEQHHLIPDTLHDAYRGGLGAVILLNYQRAPVDPYVNLVFIPGQFQRGRRRYYSATQLYAGSQAGVVNGRENWGFPKQLATAAVELSDDGRTTTYAVGKPDGQPFFRASVRSGILRFPFNTFVSPVRVRLAHLHQDGHWLSMEPSAGGVVSLGTLTNLEIDSAHFPDVTTQKLLGMFELINVRLTYPIPEVV